MNIEANAAIRRFLDQLGQHWLRAKSADIEESYGVLRDGVKALREKCLGKALAREDAATTAEAAPAEPAPPEPPATPSSEGKTDAEAQKPASEPAPAPSAPASPSSEAGG